MAYIGRSVDVGMFEKQVLTADSSTTTFTLTFAVGSANSLLVVYGGVIQEPAVAYSVSGGGQQIVFSEAPVTGTTTYIIYLGKQLTTPRAAGQETTKQTFAGDGSTTLFTLTDPPVVPAGIMVFVDGILQREGAGNNYVSGGSTINFNGAPDSGAEIDVYTLVKEKVSIDTVADGSITRAKMAATFPYWDAQGNFGIGAATPTSKLHIADDGDTALTIQSITGSGQSPSIRLQRGTYGTDGFNDVRIYNTTGGLYVDNINASNEATNLLTATTTGLGIGTTSPARKLDVVGAIRSAGVSNPYVEVNNGTSSGYLELRGGSNDLNIEVSGANSQIFRTNNAERMRIKSDGILLLGTTSDPQGSFKFRISGTDTVVPGIVFNNTTNTKDYSIYSVGTSFNIRDNTVGENRLTINTSGAVGIATSNPASSLDVATSSGSAGQVNQHIILTRGTSNGAYLATERSAVSNDVSALIFGVNSAEKVRIDSSGNAFFGGNFTVAYPGSGNTTTGIFLESSGQLSVSRDNTVAARFNRNSTDGTLISCSRQGTQVGTIGVTTSATSYNTSSDYRLKNTIAPMTGALAKVTQLKPVTYKWNVDGSNGEGFIAHELAEVCPQAVHGEKDAVETYTDEDDNEQTRPIYQGVDTSFLVATLTAAIQELKAIVDAQAVEIAALKAK